MKDIMVAGIGPHSAIPLMVEAGKRMVILDMAESSLLKRAVERVLEVDAIAVISIAALESVAVVSKYEPMKHNLTRAILDFAPSLTCRPEEVFYLTNDRVDYNLTAIEDEVQSNFIYGDKPSYIREMVHSRGRGCVKPVDKRKKVKQARKLARISKRKRK